MRGGSPLRRPAILAVLALGLGGPLTPAAAQTPTQRAIILFNEARVHYNLGQYQLAIDKLGAAIRADPSLPGPYRNLGLAYHALGKCELAVPHYRMYLKLQPTSRHAERVRREIEQCRGKHPDESPLGEAQLVLRVSVERAAVHVDGLLRGASPLGSLPVLAGRHVVAVYRSGYFPWTQVVTVTKGQVLELAVTLRPDPSLRPDAPGSRPGSQPAGRLRLIGLPPRSAVTIDGSLAIPDRNDELPVEAGRRTVAVTLAGATRWEAQLEVRPNRTTSVLPILNPTTRTRTLRRWAWGTAGAAAALGLGGAILGLVENRTFEEIRGYDRASGTRAELDALVNRRSQQALGANLLYGLAAGALGASLILFATTPELPPDAARARW